MPINLLGIYIQYNSLRSVAAESPTKNNDCHDCRHHDEHHISSSSSSDHRCVFVIAVGDGYSDVPVRFFRISDAERRRDDRVEIQRRIINAAVVGRLLLPSGTEASFAFISHTSTCNQRHIHWLYPCRRHHIKDVQRVFLDYLLLKSK